MKRNKNILIIFTIIIFVLVTLFMLNRSPSSPEEIVFKDERLKQAIIKHLELMDKPFSTKTLHLITDLDASGFDIEYLDGIENLVNLNRLILQDNYIKDVSPLASLSQLNELNLRNNEIIDLKAIQFDKILNLPLTHLSLRHNVLRYEDGSQSRLADLTLIHSLTDLEFLELRDNHISNITPLSGLLKLKYLDLRENRIADISSLTLLTQLEYLNLRENAIRDISFIKNHQNLMYLNLHSNTQIRNIEPIAQLLQLQALILRHVDIQQQTHFLKNLINLERLNVRDTNIIDVEFLVELMKKGALQDNLENNIEAEVDIRDNPFSSITDVYETLRPYWSNITYRYPEILPNQDG